MEHNQPKNQKLLTPLLLATAAITISAPVMAYDHDKQMSYSGDESSSKGIVFAMTFNGTATYSGGRASDSDHDN